MGSQVLKIRFLYADPTRSALQVFLRRPGETSSIQSDLPAEQGAEEGIWINADPVPGCVVCNIGESTDFLRLLELFNLIRVCSKCGKSGRMACIRAHCTEWFTGDRTTGEDG